MLYIFLHRFSRVLQWNLTSVNCQFNRRNSRREKKKENKEKVSIVDKTSPLTARRIRMDVANRSESRCSPNRSVVGLNGGGEQQSRRPSVRALERIFTFRLKQEKNREKEKWSAYC